MAAAVSTAPNEPTKESEPSGVAEAGEGLSLEAPPRATEGGDKITFVQPPEGGDKTKSKV